MSKYILEVQKESEKVYNVPLISYFEGLLASIRDFRSRGAIIFVGTKWVRVMDCFREYLLYEEKVYRLDLFKQFCLERGVRFVKK